MPFAAVRSRTTLFSQISRNLATDNRMCSYGTNMTLDHSLECTVIWLHFREFLEQHTLADQYLDLLWPEGTVPHQQEMATLQQQARRLQRLVLALLERSERHGTLSKRMVTEALALGVELPQTIKEKVT